MDDDFAALFFDDNDADVTMGGLGAHKTASASSLGSMGSMHGSPTSTSASSVSLTAAGHGQEPNASSEASSGGPKLHHSPRPPSLRLGVEPAADHMSPLQPLPYSPPPPLVSTQQQQQQQPQQQQQHIGYQYVHQNQRQQPVIPPGFVMGIAPSSDVNLTVGGSGAAGGHEIRSRMQQQQQLWLQQQHKAKGKSERAPKLSLLPPPGPSMSFRTSMRNSNQLASSMFGRFSQPPRNSAAAAVAAQGRTYKTASKPNKSKFTSVKSTTKKTRGKSVASKAKKASSTDGTPAEVAVAATAKSASNEKQLLEGKTDIQAKKKRRGTKNSGATQGDIRERKRLHNAAEKRRQQKISAQIEDLKITVQTASGQDIPRGRAHVLAATHAFLTKILMANQQVMLHKNHLELELSSLRKQLVQKPNVPTPTPSPPLITGNGPNGDLRTRVGDEEPLAMDVDGEIVSGTDNNDTSNSTTEGDQGARAFSAGLGRRPQPISVQGAEHNESSIQMFRRLECSMSTVIFEIDRNFNICYVSPGSRYFTGEPPRLLLGKNFQNMIHHEDVRRVRPKFRALLQQG